MFPSSYQFISLHLQLSMLSKCDGHGSLFMSTFFIYLLFSYLVTYLLKSLLLVYKDRYYSKTVMYLSSSMCALLNVIYPAPVFSKSPFRVPSPSLGPPSVALARRASAFLLGSSCDVALRSRPGLSTNIDPVPGDSCTRPGGDEID